MTDLTVMVRRFWGEAWTDGNVDAITEIFSPEATENGEPLDLEDFKKKIISLRRVFPDFSVTVEELIEVDAACVVSRVTQRGTQAEPFAGVTRPGRAFEVLGIDIFRADANGIVSLWHSTDHYDMLIQLGGKIVDA